MKDTDPTKRIPKSIGTDAKLFGTYTLSDVAVGLFPGVIVVLVTRVLLPSSLTLGGYSIQTLTLPLAAGAIIVGAVFVFLTPTYTTSIEWVGMFLGFNWKNTHVAHEQAKRFTLIDRVHPDRGVIERTDGAVIGMVEVDPPPMALATDAEWRETAEAFQDFCNTTIEFPIQIYSTTHPFPVDEYLGHFESRLADPDVRSNPRLGALIEDYIRWYAADLDDRRTTIRDHYVVVAVGPDEVQFDRESLLQQLTKLPILGVVVAAVFAPRAVERREAMYTAVDERLRRVATGIRGIDGCSARRVEVEEATRLVGEFWAGCELEYGEMDRVLRTRPIVGGRE